MCSVKQEIIEPLCRDVETDLRLHVHSSHLKGTVFVNPTKVIKSIQIKGHIYSFFLWSIFIFFLVMFCQTGVRNLAWYLQMKPLRLPFKCVDVRFLVESYLNTAFYNHTAMSSNDWKVRTTFV